MEIITSKINTLIDSLFVRISYRIPLCCIPLILFGALASAENITPATSPASLQPYIDSLKKENPSIHPQNSDDSSYSKTLQDQLQKIQPESSESYSEHLRATEPHLRSIPSNGSYSESEKNKLEPTQTGGTIEAVLSGHSELEPKIQGNIHHAFGMRYGAALSRNLTIDATEQVADFNAIYGSNYTPDVSIFYEFQPFHSNFYGNIGFIGMIGMAYFHGYGQFAQPVQRLNTGTYFPANSTVQFQFFMIPITVAVSYRFNLFKYVSPFAFIGPTSIAYTESRNDSVAGGKGHSEGFLASGGVAILMDWMMPKNSWELYGAFGIHHTYLTLEYNRLTTLKGDVNFSTYGLLAGLTFEY